MMAEARTPLVAGNWKMNGLRGRGGCAGAWPAARAGLPTSDAPWWSVRRPHRAPVTAPAMPWAEAPGRAGRPGLPRRAVVVPIPAMSARPCWRMPAAAMSSWAIRSAAPTTARPMPWCGPRPRRPTPPGLIAIICVGETEAQRDGGRDPGGRARPDRRLAAADARPANSVVAYEPVWAIGTGRTPTAEEVAGGACRDPRGSWAVEWRRERRPESASSTAARSSPENAAELLGLADVDGALVGGASLKAEDFLAIAGGIRAKPNGIQRLKYLLGPRAIGAPRAAAVSAGEPAASDAGRPRATNERRLP